MDLAQWLFIMLDTSLSITVKYVQCILNSITVATNINGANLQLNWPNDENLRKQAILAFTGSYDPHTGSLDSEGAYGLIWRVRNIERSEDYYIPQVSTIGGTSQMIEK